MGARVALVSGRLRDRRGRGPGESQEWAQRELADATSAVAEKVLRFKCANEASCTCRTSGAFRDARLDTETGAEAIGAVGE